ncbi:MAG: hypothetical protein IT262_18715 [Saprospiraceae bacterium]|nr:hypothetical protein [Saprospiraceae bacterium]
MTKTYFTILISIFSLTVYAQKPVWDKIYLDGELGLLSVGDGVAPFGATDISLGYRLDPSFAVGASLIAWLKPNECCGPSATGTGLQLRFTPAKTRLMMKVETGYVLWTGYASDSEYPAIKNTAASGKNYLRASADWRFGGLTTGLTLAWTSRQFYDYFDENNRLLSTDTFRIGAVSVHVGFALPRELKVGDR